MNRTARKVLNWTACTPTRDVLIRRHSRDDSYFGTGTTGQELPTSGPAPDPARFFATFRIFLVRPCSASSVSTGEDVEKSASRRCIQSLTAATSAASGTWPFS